MLPLFQHRALTLSLAILALLAPLSAQGGSWEANIDYGGTMSADLFVPDEPAERAPLVVVLHYCGGQKSNVQPWLQTYADMHGFYIVTPKAGGSCFDASPQRSGERADVVAMVQYTVTKHRVDPSRVFAGGESSGACMTQALLAAYPEVFAAGASLAGVPAGAWTGGNSYGWSAPSRSPVEWGNIVRQVNPDFDGPWPRVQLWHGEDDTNLKYANNHPAAVAQWTNVWGLTEADGTSEMVQPEGAKSQWSRTAYTDEAGVVVVEANSGAGVSHNMSVEKLWGDVVRFFGVDKPAMQSDPDPGDQGPASGGSGGIDTTPEPSTGGGLSTGGAGAETPDDGVETGGTVTGSQAGTGGSGANTNASETGASAAAQDGCSFIRQRGWPPKGLAFIALALFGVMLRRSGFRMTCPKLDDSKS